MVPIYPYCRWYQKILVLIIFWKFWSCFWEGGGTSWNKFVHCHKTCYNAWKSLSQRKKYSLDCKTGDDEGHPWYFQCAVHLQFGKWNWDNHCLNLRNKAVVLVISCNNRSIPYSFHDLFSRVYLNMLKQSHNTHTFPDSMTNDDINQSC